MPELLGQCPFRPPRTEDEPVLGTFRIAFMVMLSPGAKDGEPKLVRAIGRVRARYSLRLLVRGIAAVCLCLLVGTPVAAYGLDAFRYSWGAVLVIRVLFYSALLFATARFVAWPLWRGRRHTSEATMARYVEEHEPSLDAALRSAVDLGRGESGVSTALRAKLMEQVVARLESIDLPRQVERSEIRRAGLALAGVGVLAVAGLVQAPAFVTHALPYLFRPFTTSGRSAPLFGITVTPGHRAIARGSDLEVAAALSGFGESVEVEMISRNGSGAWKRAPMSRDESSGASSYRFMLLSVQEATEYFVEASPARSDVFRIDVIDRPYVKKVDLEYRLPAYTGLKPVRVENSGDITTLAGATVVVSITPTTAVKAGRLAVQGDEARPVTLAAAGKGLVLSGQLPITRPGFYKVELQGDDGIFVTASPDYLIEVIPDLPPRIAFDKPGRDAKASTIEEVFTQVKAEDDFGVSKVDLFYSVNGGAETEVPLHRAPALKELIAGHTFFLEEMSLKPGDFISYYARAQDLGAPPRQATTDIYFLEARPYRRDFRQAEQSGQQGGGEGGGGAAALSQQQRQIIAATFRLAREVDSIASPSKTLAQDTQTVALIQGRLRTQVETLITRMESRGALPEGSPMHGTADELRQALAKMAEAESELKDSRPKPALPSEQAALAHLQRAEAAFREVQVAFGGGGGGGGGQSNASAEELADLFELDLDKLRNQYESLQSGSREQRENAVDDAMARLEELARRQEQENERAQKRGARAPNQAGAQGGSSQRQLADEAEELGRRLERLTREKPSPALEESTRRLREAASAMRQQASGSRNQAPGATPIGESPLDRLREARRVLDQDRSTRLGRDLTEAAEKAEALKTAQGRIAEDMRELATGSGADGSTAPGESGSSKSTRIKQRKDSLASEVADLEAKLDRVAGDARREQKEASRKLQGAANGIRDSKLKEKIRYTKGLVDRAATGAAEPFEADISESIKKLADQIREAGQAVGVSPEKKKAAALDKARDLAQGLDSIGERLRARSRSGAPGGKTEAPEQGGQGAEGGNQALGETAPGNAAGGRQPAASRDQGGRAGGGGGAGRLGAEEARQLQRELAARAGDAEAFKRELEQGGLSSAQAAALAQRIQGLASGRNFKDPLGLAELTAQIAEDVKMLEYVLRREIDGDRPTLQLSGSEELPPGYRGLVEEYYKTLARKPRK